MWVSRLGIHVVLRTMGKKQFTTPPTERGARPDRLKIARLIIDPGFPIAEFETPIDINCSHPPPAFFPWLSNLIDGLPPPVCGALMQDKLPIV